MCVRQVTALTGIVPEVPEHRRSPQNSGTRAPILDDRDNNFRDGTRDFCSKYNRGRKAHDHIEHLRRARHAIKRQTI